MLLAIDTLSAGWQTVLYLIALLLFTASGVFVELQDALNNIWGVAPKPGRGVLGIVRDRLLSFGMVLVVGFLLLVSLVITTALAAVGEYAAGLAPGVPVLMQVANIWSDKIGDGGAAAEVYERVLAIDPSNMTASIELEALYRQRSNWMKLVELLLARVDRVANAG